jgi:hypothetical protein
MSSNGGWIGVDLDGALAHYTGWKGEDHIGDPVPAMAERVRNWLADGIEVRIFTARANGSEAAIKHIHEWAMRHFGVAMLVTCHKDFKMIELWDDRCVQIEPNTGRRMDGKD